MPGWAWALVALAAIQAPAGVLIGRQLRGKGGPR